MPILSATATVPDPEADLYIEPSLPANWSRLLAPYRKPNTSYSLFQLFSTLALFVLVWWAALWSLNISYWLTLPLCVLGGGLCIRLFIFCHDCAHGSFFKSRKANHFVGRVLGVLTLTPYQFWRKNHILHHSTSGNLDRRGNGDVSTLMVDEYLALPRIQRFWYRVSRNPFVFVAFGPIYLFLLKHRLPLGMPASWAKEWRSVLWNNVALAAVILTMGLLVGFANFFLVHGPVFLVSGVAGVWLFYVQHQYADTYWRKDEDWDYVAACFSGSSFYDLPAPVRWFTGNIGYHHIHHLCSSIPNYKLKKCMDEVAELPAPRRLTFWKSLACARLALWDPAVGKLVSFRDARRSREPLAGA